MRKQSVKSNNAPTNSSKPYNSLRKDNQLKRNTSKNTLKEEPTTEKKNVKQGSPNDIKIKPGYGS